MAKAARSFFVMSTPVASAEQSAHDQSVTDIFMSVMIFSLVGLVVSLTALLMGVPLVWD